MIIVQTEIGNQKAHDCFTNGTGNKKHMIVLQMETGNQKAHNCFTNGTGNQTIILLRQKRIDTKHDDDYYTIMCTASVFHQPLRYGRTAAIPRYL